MWILLGVFSSFFLGFHEIFKKVGLVKNAVVPVLLVSTIAGALTCLPFWAFSRIAPNAMPSLFFIPEQSWLGHLLFFTKAVIVAAAWVFGYYSVKHLPVTVISPIVASGPIWSIVGAIIIYGEVLSGVQWIGVAVTMGFYLALSLNNRRETELKGSSKWLIFAFLNVLFNSASALFDKYLVQHYDRLAMQCWFTVYTALLFFLLLMIFRRRLSMGDPYQFRWAIPMIGIFLIVADYFYFMALSLPGGMVSILMVLRRASSVLVFATGALYFKEGNFKNRLVYLIGILAGVVIVVWEY